MRPAPSRRHRPRPRHLEADRRAHGGTLAVESDVGVGSIFRFELPLVIAAASAPTAEVLPDLRGCRILVAADGPMRAPFSARASRVRGASVTRTADVDSAMAALSGRPSPLSSLIRLRLDATRGSCGGGARRGGQRLVMPPPTSGAASVRPGGGLRRLSGEAGASALALRPSRRIGTRRSGDHPLAATEGPAAPARLTVLLAEDNPINALLARKLLEKAGVESSP